MRSLPSIASADLIVANVSVAIYAPDSSFLGNFSTMAGGDLAGLQGLSYEVPFLGGLGRPVSYDATLSTSLGWVAQHRTRLIKAEARLRVDANSDTFYPHVGRVRGWDRDPNDPNLLTLHIFDRFLDTDPLFPVEALVDSWSTPHLEDLESGYPLYYGQHLRPAYMAAVTCNLSVLLGPRNVSSANHVTSLWFNPDPLQGVDPAAQHILLMKSVWSEQSDAANQAGGGRPFEVTDVNTVDVRLWQFTGSGLRADLGQSIQTTRGGYISFTTNPASLFERFSVVPQSRITQLVKRMYGYSGGWSVAGGTLTGSASLEWDVLIDSGDSIGFNGIVGLSATSNAAAGFTNTFSTHVDSPRFGPVMFDMLANSLYQNNLRMSFTLAKAGGQSGTIRASLMLTAELLSSVFKRYAVFAPQMSSLDVAISANPLAILDDVLSHHTQTPYRQDQSSASQTLIQSFQFNCLFHERQKLSAILDEFARTCGFYAWAGDSGMVNYRVYQESGAATVDRVVPTSEQFTLFERANPLGTSAFETQGASKLRVDFAYDYPRAAYAATAFADRTNNSLCNSAFVAGLQKEAAMQSKYIMAAAVASLALGNLVRRNAVGQEFVEMDLPARYFVLEPADVLRVQHPALPNSEGLYQVTRLEPDFMAGRVKVTAGKLISLTP